jgi:predicted permease
MSVGLANAAPMETFLAGSGNQVQAEDRVATDDQPSALRGIRRVAPGFFATMGTRVIAGRDFSWDDLYGGRRVAIVSENLAREWWGAPDAALGKRIREAGAGDPWREIVGVVEDVYDNGVHAKPPAFAYWPALMDRYIWGRENGSAVVSGMFAIRSNRTGTEALLAQAREAIWSVNGRQPVFFVSTLESLYDQSMARTSFTLVMLALAAGMGLILGIVGIYGVIAYVVSRRKREIGIRSALGAQPAELLAMFVRRGAWLAAVGAAIGLAAAAGLTRLMSSLLFGVTPLDPLTYSAVAALLIVTCVVASYLPARRGIAADPIQALRAE